MPGVPILAPLEHNAVSGQTGQSSIPDSGWGTGMRFVFLIGSGGHILCMGARRRGSQGLLLAKRSASCLTFCSFFQRPSMVAAIFSFCLANSLIPISPYDWQLSSLLCRFKWCPPRAAHSYGLAGSPNAISLTCPEASGRRGFTPSPPTPPGMRISHRAVHKVANRCQYSNSGTKPAARMRWLLIQKLAA